MLTYKDFAVLYRTKQCARRFEHAFVSMGVPVIVIGGDRFADRMEVKDICAYLRLVAHPNDVIAFQRAINTPSRELGTKSVATILLLARLRDVNLIEACRLLMVEGGITSVDGKPVRVRREGLKAFVKIMDALVTCLGRHNVLHLTSFYVSDCHVVST